MNNEMNNFECDVIQVRYYKIQFWLIGCVLRPINSEVI